jgi:hypothetical protein
MTTIRTIALCGTILVATVATSVAARQTQSTAGRDMTRAKPGEPVLLIINVVKADKKQQFEDYLDKFLAALAKVGSTDSVVKRTELQTRLLSSSKANEDGTFTYVFLMDPMVDGADYDMLHVLQRAMPKEDADRLIRQFVDSVIAEEPQMFELVQSKR